MAWTLVAGLPATARPCRFSCRQKGWTDAFHSVATVVPINNLVLQDWTRHSRTLSTIRLASSAFLVSLYRRYQTFGLVMSRRHQLSVERGTGPGRECCAGTARTVRQVGGPHWCSRQGPPDRRDLVWAVCARTMAGACMVKLSALRRCDGTPPAVAPDRRRPPRARLSARPTLSPEHSTSPWPPRCGP